MADQAMALLREPDDAVMDAAMRAGCDTISDMCNFPACAKSHHSLGGSASCWSHYRGRVRLALKAVAAQLAAMDAAPEIADIDAATGSADDRGLYDGAALDTQTAPSLPETP